MNNMTDIIEQYIKQLFQDSENDFITLKRSNVAEKFDCVPSQLNYVIKTRFTPEQGFLIESKRGGGGFIRITKVTLHNNIDYIDYLIQNIEKENVLNIDYNKILKILKEDEYINYFEYITIKTAIDNFDKMQLKINSIISEHNSKTREINDIIYNDKKEFLIKILINMKYNKEI